MTLTNIYLFIGNHNSRLGIEDHITILQEIFRPNSFKIIVVTDIVPNKINLFIEEQSKKSINDTIIKIKTLYPKTKLIMLLTEFPTYNSNEVSYNQFETKGNLYNIYKLIYEFSDYFNIANNKLLDEDNIPPTRRTKKTLYFIAKAPPNKPPSIVAKSPQNFEKVAICLKE